MMVVVAELAAPSNLEIVLGMVPALWGTVHVGLAESLTEIRAYEMTVAVAEVASNLEVVLSVAEVWGTGLGLGLA